MKITQSLLVVVPMLLSQSVMAGNHVVEGEKLYKTYCSACHGVTGGMDMSRRMAPPVIAVRMHYLGPYPDKEAFVAAVANWVGKPDERNALMRGAIRKFNLMPPVSVSRQDAEKIAAYIYEGELESPEGFDKHFEEMHGKPPGKQGI